MPGVAFRYDGSNRSGGTLLRQYLDEIGAVPLLTAADDWDEASLTWNNQPGGATLIIGRVERPPDALRARLAREMRERLRRQGFAPRSERNDRRLIEACVRHGAVALEPTTVVTWATASSVRQSLDAWRSLSGLGGIEVPGSVRDIVLEDLQEWAAGVFGDLERTVESEESYVLRAVRLFPRQ